MKFSNLTLYVFGSFMNEGIYFTKGFIVYFNNFWAHKFAVASIILLLISEYVNLLWTKCSANAISIYRKSEKSFQA